MTAAPDLVARLRAAIDYREGECHRAAEELREAARLKVSSQFGEFILGTIADGLRMCRSHRDLIGRIENMQHRVVEDDGFYTCAAATEERDGDTTWRDGAGAKCDCGRDRLVAGLLGDLARGYGVEDQT